MTITFSITAVTKEKAIELYHYGESMEDIQNNNSSENDQEIIDKLNEMIKYFNENEYWEFSPTDSQIQEMVEFYKKNSDNFSNEKLKEFVLSKDWLVRGVIHEEENEEPKTNDSASTKKDTSSNKSSSNNSSSSTKKETTSTTTTPTTSDNKSTSSNQSKSNKSEEKTTTETNESKPLSAIVRVQVHNTDSSKKYEYVGKSVKVMLNNETKEDNYFNGDNYTATFLNVSTQQATIKVYVDGNLVKTQQADIENLAKQGNYYTDVDVNI